MQDNRKGRPGEGRPLCVERVGLFFGRHIGRWLAVLHVAHHLGHVHEVAEGNQHGEDNADRGPAHPLVPRLLRCVPVVNAQGSSPANSGFETTRGGILAYSSDYVNAFKLSPPKFARYCAKRLISYTFQHSPRKVDLVLNCT